MNCCICEKDAGKYGNNAQPIIEGRCCDKCNERLVVPLRIKISIMIQEIGRDIEETVSRNKDTGKNHEKRN
jgi:hypothetical protein